MTSNTPHTNSQSTTATHAPPSHHTASDKPDTRQETDDNCCKHDHDTVRARFRQADRGAAFNVSYVLGIAVTSIIVISVVTVVGGLIDAQQDRAVRQQADVIGDRVASTLMSVDTAGNKTTQTNVTVTLALKPRITGEQYTVTLDNTTGTPHVSVAVPEQQIRRNTTLAVDASITRTRVRGGGTINIVHRTTPATDTRTVTLTTTENT